MIRGRHEMGEAKSEEKERKKCSRCKLRRGFTTPEKEHGKKKKKKKKEEKVGKYI